MVGLKMSKRIILILFLLNMFNCRHHHALDCGVGFCGNVVDQHDNSIDSAKIEVTNIKGVGHSSIDDFIGRIYYSDENGGFCLDLPGGVEWDENSVSGEKTYTKYIESATIKISKVLFEDTVVTFKNKDYENSYINIDIVLESK